MGKRVTGNLNKVRDMTTREQFVFERRFFRTRKRLGIKESLLIRGLSFGKQITVSQP